MLTSSIKKDDIQRDWYIVDADNKTLGALVCKAKADIPQSTLSV